MFRDFFPEMKKFYKFVYRWGVHPSTFSENFGKIDESEIEKITRRGKAE